MAPPRLTVVLPNYNHAKPLPRALAALAAQTRQADEILMIDDASTDDSLAVAATWQMRLPQLRIIAQRPNRGVVETLRRGIAEASGDLVYLGAADDETRPALFARCVAALEAHPEAALAAGEVRLVDPEGRFAGLRPAVLPSLTESYLDPAAFAAALRRGDHLVVSVGAVWRRVPLLAAGGIDPTLGAMVDAFLARELALQHGIVFFPEVLGVWHINLGGVSRSAAANPHVTLDLIARARARMEERLGAPYPAWYPALFERRTRFAAARLLVIEPPGGRINPSAVAMISGGGSLDRLALHIAQVLPGAAARFAAMAWLTLRLRPYSVPALLASWRDRRRRPRA